MRWLGITGAAVLLSGCVNGLAQRQAELSRWIGQPETELVSAMGAPNRAYDSGSIKVLTYEEVYVEQNPTGPYYFGPGPAGPSGFVSFPYTTVCDTSFTIADGVVKAFSLRGNGCG